MSESFNPFDIDLNSKKVFNNISSISEKCAPLYRRAYGKSVKFTAFTSAGKFENGKTWHPSAINTNNIINIDLGEEIDLASAELVFEENKSKKYEYYIYGIKDGNVHLLCNRISEKNKNFEKIEGTFRYLIVDFLSESEYLDEETHLIAGIEKIGVYMVHKKTSPPRYLIP